MSFQQEESPEHKDDKPVDIDGAPLEDVDGFPLTEHVKPDADIDGEELKSVNGLPCMCLLSLLSWMYCTSFAP